MAKWVTSLTVNGTSNDKELNEIENTGKANDQHESLNITHPKKSTAPSVLKTENPDLNTTQKSNNALLNTGQRSNDPAVSTISGGK